MEGKMDIYKARQELKTKRLQDMHLRVVNYDRVSTDKEEQKSSIINQNLFNTKIIKDNPNWVYAGSYVDDAASGLSVDKRNDFKQMLIDAQKGKFDLIITKEVPRFARNTLDSIKYVRMLLEWGVGVWFINNNIISFADESEFIFVLMAGQAQEESRRISNRVRFGHKQSIRRGHVLGTDNLYGYVKKDCVLKVDEKTKDMITYIFNKYATGTTSTTKLSNEIYDMGYRNRNGGKISSRTISNIIKNPKYKGFYVGGKVVIEDMFTKKQRFINENDWVTFKDETGKIVPALVSEEIWDRANEVYKSRSESLFGERKTSYKDNLFTGKIKCAFDGSTYWLRARGKKENRHDIIWECSSHKKNGAASCPSIAIYQRELLMLIEQIIACEIGDFHLVLDEYIDIFKQRKSLSSSQTELSRIEKELISIRKKRDKLLDHNLNGRISDDDFYKKDCELKELQSQMEDDKNSLLQADPEKEIEEMIADIKKHVDQLSHVTINDITKETINLLFDKIYAEPVDSKSMNLTFVLNLGYDVSKLYKKSRIKKSKTTDNCPSVNMLKKMIEQQEKQMAGK